MSSMGLPRLVHILGGLNLWNLMSFCHKENVSQTKTMLTSMRIIHQPPARAGLSETTRKKEKIQRPFFQ